LHYNRLLMQDDLFLLQEDFFVRHADYCVLQIFHTSDVTQ